MYSLYNAKLMDLIPPNLRDDPDMKAASQMEDKAFFLLMDKVRKVLILPNLDELDDNTLDHLAWQMNVDFYEMDLPIDKKVGLIQNAILFKIRKGTAGAVEDILSVVFDKSSVKEWFEYDGEPYMFKITTTDFVSEGKYQSLKTVMNTVKNTRSHLESFIIERTKTTNLYFLAGTHRVKKRVINPAS